jgi:LPXTG-motif cell wall-anchored protein
MKNIKKIMQLIAVVGIFMGTAVPAHAAFPGSNGKLVYGDFVIENGGPAALPFNSINLDGTNKTTLVDEVASTRLVGGGGRFSPDGKKIVFSKVNVDTGESNIYIMNADGSSQQNITSIDPSSFPDRSGYGAQYAAFSPDDTKVVFAEVWSEDLGSGAESMCNINTVNVDGSNKQAITNDTSLCDMYPVYSPDGSRIAFLRSDKPANSTGLYVMNADGSNVTLVKTLASVNLYLDDFTFAPLGTAGSSIDWSPDGSKLVYATYQQEVNGVMTSTIEVTDIEGNTSTVVSFSSPQFDTIEETGNHVNVAFLNPQFTPEGQIVFKYVSISADRTFDSDQNQWTTSNEQGIARIQLINPDGSGLRTVLTSDSLIGNDSNFVLFLYSFPSVQPILSNESSENSTGTLASTGSNSSASALIAAALISISFIFVLARKTRML